MIDRRELLFGGACVAALGTGLALRPRKLKSLLHDEEIGTIIPRHFGPWSSHDGGDIVTPKTPGSLADRLYSQTVTRTYVNKTNNMVVMLLIAYGQSQSDLLQLHRPESCYPAIGFTISGQKSTDIQVPGAVPLPATALTASNGGRIEDIVYWTRLAEYFPRTAGEQRSDRLKTAMSGIIGDGVLVRASAIRMDSPAQYGEIEQFLTSLIAGMAPDKRNVLIGTGRAEAMVRNASTAR